MVDNNQDAPPSRCDRISLTVKEGVWELIDTRRADFRLNRDDYIGAMLYHALASDRFAHKLPQVPELSGRPVNYSFMSTRELWADFRWQAAKRRLRGAEFFTIIASFYGHTPPSDFDPVALAAALPPIDDEKRRALNFRRNRFRRSPAPPYVKPQDEET